MIQAWPFDFTSILIWLFHDLLTCGIFLSEINTYQCPSIFSGKFGFSCSVWKAVDNNVNHPVPKLEYRHLPVDLDFYFNAFHNLFLFLSFFDIMVSFQYCMLSTAILNILNIGRKCHLGVRLLQNLFPILGVVVHDLT